MRKKAQANDTSSRCLVPGPALCPGLYADAGELAGARIVFIPVGSFEDHGSRPMILDTLLSLCVACSASILCSSTIVAWPLGYGYSPLHATWAGFEPELLSRIVSSLVLSVKHATPHAQIVVIDGHYGHKGVVGSATLRAGAAYFNTWGYLSSRGLDVFEKQVSFEKQFWRECVGEPGEALKLVGEAANFLCEWLASSFNYEV